ncbi:MAG: aldehyde ferredoxin oxidoreductase N-terminal domain-containing protein [Candidatus Bathyarchaeota archaeon]
MSQEYYGYAGKILHVNLTTEKVSTEKLNLDIAKKFIGGFGLNQVLAYNYIKPHIPPLSPESFIIFGAGPLVGTLVPGAVKCVVTYKAPYELYISNRITSGTGGRSFGSMLKWAGYDHLIITGKADRPVYLKIFDENVEICEAYEVWGKDIFKTTDILWEKHGKSCSVLAIGPAAENLVKFSIVFVDKISHLGRDLGAILGFKKLKAIVIKGEKGIKVVNPKGFLETVNEISKRMVNAPIREAWLKFKHFLNWNRDTYIHHHRGFSITIPKESVERVAGPEVYRKSVKKGVACPSCLMADKDVFKDEKTGLVSYHSTGWGPFHVYGSIFNAENSSEILECSNFVDKNGLDEFEFCRILEYLIYLYEEGVLSENDTGGLSLKRNCKTVLTLAEKIVKREGFGDVLADGLAEAIRKINLLKGIKTETYIGWYHPSNPQTVLLFDARLNFGTESFGQIVNPRGWSGFLTSATYTLTSQETLKRYCKRIGMPEEAINKIFTSPFNVGILQKHVEDWQAIAASLGLCNRVPVLMHYNLENLAQLYTLTTGVKLNPEDLKTAGERIWNLYRILNIREGYSKENEKPPKIWFKPLETHKGEKIYLMDYFKTKVLVEEDVKKLLKDYYIERGCDPKTGKLEKEKLVKLGLEEFLT